LANNPIIVREGEDTHSEGKLHFVWSSRMLVWPRSLAIPKVYNDAFFPDRRGCVRCFDATENLVPFLETKLWTEASAFRGTSTLFWSGL
jgi:hypothetical protein